MQRYRPSQIDTPYLQGNASTMRYRAFVQALGLAFVLLPAVAATAAEEAAEAEQPMPQAEQQAGAADFVPLTWYLDYGEATRVAKLRKQMLFIHFYAPNSDPWGEKFEAESIDDSAIRLKLRNVVTARLPIDKVIRVNGEEQKLLAHGAFAELQGGDGIAVLDFANPDTPHYGHVVSVLPFDPGKYYRYKPEHLQVLLDLPAGTLTQRTLILAVRIHPEKPASTVGELDPVLTEEAGSHSNYQAQIRVQGHHNWGSRFPRLARLLPFGLRAQEVVAESWPDERIVDAAVDVVDSWRQSPGHWGAVRSNQPRFGYDMRRGGNGIWYATGLFGNRH
jgi:hypothetical protein